MFPAEETASAEAGAQAPALAVCIASPKFPLLASSSLLATTLSRAHGSLCKAGPHDLPSRRFCCSCPPLQASFSTAPPAHVSCSRKFPLMGSLLGSSRLNTLFLCLIPSWPRPPLIFLGQLCLPNTLAPFPRAGTRTKIRTRS